MALRYSPIILSKEWTWDALRLAFTITGCLEFGPINSYLMEEGRGFNSTLRACLLSYEDAPSDISDSNMPSTDDTCGELLKIEHTLPLHDSPMK